MLWWCENASLHHRKAINKHYLHDGDTFYTLLRGVWCSVNISIAQNDNLCTLPSIDLLDMAFNYMDIEDETCRMKTICQAENYAVNHPVARLAINTLK